MIKVARCTHNTGIDGNAQPMMLIQQLLMQLIILIEPKNRHQKGINIERFPRYKEGDMESISNQPADQPRRRDQAHRSGNSSNRFSALAEMSSDKESPGSSSEVNTPESMDQNTSSLSSMITLFPLPYQQGAPYFDGKDVTKFLNRWETLTFEWNDEKKIKKMIAYCDEVTGRYIQTLPSYEQNDWAEFRKELLAEYKEEDGEQRRNTETYLQELAQYMRKDPNPSTPKCRTYIFEFTERSNKLLERRLISKHTQVILFLQGFSNKTGDKLCKRCGIDVEDWSTTENVWENLKKEALKVTSREDSQMSKLWKIKEKQEVTLKDG